jgi:2-methylcitrate dehydratase PrpD
MEVVTRLGAAVRHGFHSHGFHATSVCGTLASALSVSRIYASSLPKTVAAMGIAGSFASGSLEFLADGSATKQLHPGWAGHAGILAARLAAAGASGPSTILEGEHGIFRSYVGKSVSADQLSDGLGSRWESQRITVKPYPACQLSHATLDAVKSAGVKAAEVESIKADIPAESIPIVCQPVEGKLTPRSAYEAKFSLPWCVAALLIDGSLGIEAFEEKRLGRPDVLELARRVTWRGYQPDVAAAAAPGSVEIRLRGGRVLNASVPTSSGAPDAPLSDQQLVGKFLLNAGPDPGLAQEILDFEHLASIRKLSGRLAA